MMSICNQVDIYNPYENKAVTGMYISIICNAFEHIGLQCRQVQTLMKDKTSVHRTVLVISAMDVIKAKKAGYRKIVYWVQGIAPEESYMRHNSMLRFRILSFIEKKAIKKADFIFLVSNAMKEHFENKYKLQFENYFIMPCFNEQIEKESFEEHVYCENQFVYAGSMAKWQCFEETLDVYKQIEEKYPQVCLRVLTNQQEEAEMLIKEKKIKRYSIDYVPQEKVKEEMKKAKFGFCIRKDSAVNNVATPTKLSSYVTNGVIPIYTSSIRDFYSVAKDNPYCLCMDEDNFWTKLDALINENVEWKKIFDEYYKTFEAYFSREKYETEIADKLAVFLENRNDTYNKKNF